MSRRRRRLGWPGPVSAAAAGVAAAALAASGLSVVGRVEGWAGRGAARLSAPAVPAPGVGGVLADRQVAGVARRSGCWRGGDLVTAVAVALAESGGRAGARGDVLLEGAGWGPSVGLWQIRSRRAERGTGRVRDELANRGPRANAAHACALWRGRGWLPWSAYTGGAYRAYLPRARAAVRSEALLAAAGRPGQATGRGRTA